MPQNLTVKLHHLENPAKQTNFENCVADVNIPVGEVFTSPVLKGTNGTLAVSRVVLKRTGVQKSESGNFRMAEFPVTAAAILPLKRKTRIL